MTLIITSEYELQRIQPPALPLATEQYNPTYQNQLNNVLRLYFNRLQNILGQMNTGSIAIDGSGIRLPYGAFSSYTTQSTTANTATLMTLSTTDFSNGVSISSSKITVTTAGIYNLQFSVQLENLDNASQDVSIWLKQNGTDISGSTGLVGMAQRKGPSDPTHDIKGWNYFLSMKAGDYVQIYWSTTSASVTIPTYAAGTSPTRPTTASVVATMTFVSALS